MFSILWVLGKGLLGIYKWKFNMSLEILEQIKISNNVFNENCNG